MYFSNLLFNFVRKIRIFNKNRYSRNRQNVRVIFYFSIYFNIMIIYLIYGLIYSLIPNITYIWWLYYILLISFILTSFYKVIKYNSDIFRK